MNNQIQIITGDITKLKVDAIVNAANETLLGGGGVDGAIHRVAGPRLKIECRALGGCKTGEAKITNGYNLPAPYVIHTVGPIYDPKQAQKQASELASCYVSSLNLAKKHNLHTIAFPSISTGLYGFPKSLAIPIVYETVKSWLYTNSDCKLKIIFCCYDKETFDLYKQIFKL